MPAGLHLLAGLPLPLRRRLLIEVAGRAAGVPPRERTSAAAHAGRIARRLRATPAPRAALR